MRMHTALLLVNDLGLQFWLAEALGSEGIAALPANTPSAARKLLTQLGLSVDLMIVDPAIAGGGRLIEVLSHSQPHLRVLSVPSSSVLSRDEWLNLLPRRATAARGISKSL